MSSWSSRGRVVAAASIALAIAATNVPRMVHAAEPTPADKATARNAYLAGMDLRAKGDHKGALEKFKVAYALLPTPITAIEVGRSLVDLGQLVEGNEKLLEAATMPAKATESADAKKARSDAKALADQVEPRIPSIRVKLTGAPEGATVVVTIDGREVPTDALAEPRKVNPGKHAIVAKVEGGEPSETSVTVAERETREVKLKVRAPEVAPTAPRRGREGERASETPRVEASSGTSTWAYVGFAIGGVGLIAGGITGVSALSKDNDLATACRDHTPACDQGHIDARDNMRTGAIVSFVVAGVGAGVGVAALVWGGGEKRTSAGITPWVGLGSVGLRGAF